MSKSVKVLDKKMGLKRVAKARSEAKRLSHARKKKAAA